MDRANCVTAEMPGSPVEFFMLKGSLVKNTMFYLQLKTTALRVRNETSNWKSLIQKLLF